MEQSVSENAALFKQLNAIMNEGDQELRRQAQ
jgi:hypothetical protein